MSKNHKMKQALIIKSELKKMNILIITGGDHPYKETTPILNELIISNLSTLKYCKGELKDVPSATFGLY